MTIITDERCTGYVKAGHPERPARIERTVNRLRAQGEVAIGWAGPGPADDRSILRAHSPELLARLSQPGDFDADTPWHPGIADYARASVGAGLEALRRARAGETVFSLMRPPGHHAMRDTVMGFCYLNNAAIAALEALAAGARRVAVYDFDVHHGNGTQDILLNRDGAAFYSVHQHPCYPGTGAANEGNNCFNFSVPPSASREAYRSALASALGQLKEFKPELVVVSAGFDAYVRDPLASGTLELEDFFWLGRSIRALGVPVASLLEGGYSRDLPELILAYLKGMEGIVEA